MNRCRLFLLGVSISAVGQLSAGESASPSKLPAISISGTYIAELLADLSGGKDAGVAVDGLLQLGVDVHTERLFGWFGMTIHGGLLYAHGPSLTQKYVGDFGVASNIDAYDSLRLAEAWIEQSAFGDRLSLRVGVFFADTEFCLSEMAVPFINSVFGEPTAISANFAMAAYPYSTLGLRLRVNPMPGWNLLLGAFDGNVAPGVFPDPTPGAARSMEFNHWNTHFAFRHEEGAMLFAEVGWQNVAPEPSDCGMAPLARSIKAGAVYHTDRFGRISDSTLAALNAPNSSREDTGVRGNYAFYLFAEHELWREPGSAHDGLGAFIHGTFAPPGRNFFPLSVEAGLVYRGLFQPDACDTAGLAMSWLGLSPDVREGYRAAGAQSPRDEVIVELTYQRTLTAGCTLQPDLQYIIHPGGFADHALVAGVRAVVSF